MTTKTNDLTKARRSLAGRVRRAGVASIAETFGGEASVRANDFTGGVVRSVVLLIKFDTEARRVNAVATAEHHLREAGLNVTVHEIWTDPHGAELWVEDANA